MRSAWLQEDGLEDGVRHFINERIYVYLWPIYKKYGTFYRLRMDLSGKNWDDYDENGVPYWEKTGTIDPDYSPWDFEDHNGDAFRVLK
jgi:hypothetical protein